MRTKVLAGGLALGVCLAAMISSVQAAGQDKRALVAALVSELGYGRAVHNFKDYVLRGGEAYRVKARDYFLSAKEKIGALRRLDSVTEVERMALDDLESVIDSYIAALPTIQRAYRQSRTLARVLNATAAQLEIDDQLAIESIALLRKGYQWSPVEKLVFALGYGSAIHNFKNYLIFRDEKYRQWADAWFEEALQIVARMKWRERKNSRKLAALKEVESVLNAYRSALPVMARTLEPARASQSEVVINVAVRGADKALKVEDLPALEGLQMLLAGP